MKSGDLPPEALSAILETFSELPFDVLWKTEFENVEELPENVKMVKWVPQQDVLSTEYHSWGYFLFFVSKQKYTFNDPKQKFGNNIKFSKSKSKMVTLDQNWPARTN